MAAVINNYINYMGSHYKNAYRKIIFPKLYGKEWEEPVANIENELGTDAALIDIANKYGADRGKFKPGNTQGIRFTKEGPVVDEEEREV